MLNFTFQTIKDSSLIFNKGRVGIGDSSAGARKLITSRLDYQIIFQFINHFFQFFLSGYYNSKKVCPSTTLKEQFYLNIVTIFFSKKQKKFLALLCRFLLQSIKFHQSLNEVSYKYLKALWLNLKKVLYIPEKVAYKSHSFGFNWVRPIYLLIITLCNLEYNGPPKFKFKISYSSWRSICLFLI